ncbi:MAG: carbon-nitrogen hydrolase family protein [Firmicutes bacterium]|nr:carbon-nitrogen hydrolase family protein [Bacillota bacterium]
MKTAVAIWQDKINSPDEVRAKFSRSLEQAAREGARLIVYPALAGSSFASYKEYQDTVLGLSQKHPQLAICPGSALEEEDGKIYHTSFLVQNGRVFLKQRQLYLAKWERKHGFCRGSDLAFAQIGPFKTAIILSTDVFYPRVWRYAALLGANLILSPVAIRGPENLPTQIKGVWANVQANLVFALESGFKGEYKGIRFSSKSVIHAPLAVTENDDGFLAIEEGPREYIIAELNPAQLQEASREFDPLRQLNPAAYTRLYSEVSRHA